MWTLIAVVILIVIGFFGQTFWLTVLNLAGAPGALVAWPVHNKVGSIRLILGTLVSLAGQSYVYLAFVGLVVAGTKYYIHQGAILPIFVWPASFFACVCPIYLCAAAAYAEYTPTPQVFAVLLGQFVAAIGFFVFVFFPKVIALGWPWVPWLS